MRTVLSSHVTEPGSLVHPDIYIYVYISVWFEPRHQTDPHELIIYTTSPSDTTAATTSTSAKLETNHDSHVLCRQGSICKVSRQAGKQLKSPQQSISISDIPKSPPPLVPPQMVETTIETEGGK